MRFGFILAALATFAATPAVAQVKVFARASGWEAFGGIADSKKAVCGVSVASKDSWFTLKYFKGDKVLTVQLSDSDWVGKPGDKVGLGMQFDDHKAWSAQATAFKVDKDIALQFSVDAEATDDWMHEFKESHELLIAFSNSKIPTWHADLTGTKAVGEAMEACVGAMLKAR